MMTFLFNSGDSANNSTGGTSQSGCLHDIQPSTIPDPLRFFSNEDEVFDSVSLDALLNSVHSASQHAEGDQQQVDASTTLGELSRAHAAAVQLHGGDGGQQQQQQQHGEANSYVGLNNALFRPSQPVSVSTGNVFASTPLMGMNYGMGNGGGLIIGMNGGGVSAAAASAAAPITDDAPATNTLEFYTAPSGCSLASKYYCHFPDSQLCTASTTITDECSGSNSLEF